MRHTLLTRTAGVILALAIMAPGCSPVRPPTLEALKVEPGSILQKYPEDTYLVRIGTGPSADEAAEAARLEIIQYFSVSVSATNILEQWAGMARLSATDSRRVLDALKRTVSVPPGNVSRHIQIVQNTPNQAGRYEAVAVVNKQSLAADILAEINTLDRRIDGRLATDTQSDFTALRKYAQTLHTLVRREKKRQDMYILFPGSETPPRDADARSVLAAIDSIATGEFVIGIRYPRTIEATVRSAVNTGISSLGITSREVAAGDMAGDVCDLLLTFDITAAHISGDAGRPAFRGSWTLTVTAAEPRSRPVLMAFTIEETADGATPEQARERIAARLSEIIPNRLTVQLSTLLFGDGRDSASSL